jgi:hypothetical protein
MNLRQQDGSDHGYGRKKSEFVDHGTETRHYDDIPRSGCAAVTGCGRASLAELWREFEVTEAGEN